jgi:HPt (histidine-containing phosphotransfer) domain-containing protein
MSTTPDDVPVLDLDHLRRQTAGDSALERELLVLFAAQCTRLRPLLSEERPLAERADAAHTLKGSARAIGASRLAASADRLETALRGGDPDGAASLMPQFEEVVDATRRAAARHGDATAA